MARDCRDDYSPLAPDSRDSGFGQNSQEELKLFSMAIATPGTLSSSHRGGGGGGGGGSSSTGGAGSYDSQDDESNSTGLVIGDELINPDPV